MVQSTVNLGDKIELSKKTDLVDSDTYYSMISELKENGLLTIQAPIEGGRIIPLQKETVYYANIFTDRGLLRGEVVIANRYKEDNLHLMDLELLTPLKKYQRRQYYRMNCILNFKYKDKDKEEEEWETGTILDISGGGLRFATKHQLEEQEYINCYLQLQLDDNQTMIETTGEVIQSKPIEPDVATYQTRVRFTDLSMDDREFIIKFIFEEERRRRKKEKGL